MNAILALFLSLQIGTPVSTAPDAKTVFQERQDDLIYLAGKLGGLHRLSQVCEGDGSAVFREHMKAILDGERPPRSTREAMIARFNHNYRQMADIYLICSRAAEDDFENEATVALSITDRLSAPIQYRDEG